MIGLVDYGAGNLNSVRKAFDFLGFATRRVDSAAALAGAEKLVLPGVGAFGAAARELRAKGLFQPVVEWLAAGRPFLGICLGLQLLFESSEESAGALGFGLFGGGCRRLPGRKVPQIGWNTVTAPPGGPGSALLRGLPPEPYFYFVHSFFVAPADEGLVAARTDYGGPFASIAGRGRVWGVQFHPEKSGRLGLRLLSNWVRSC